MQRNARIRSALLAVVAFCGFLVLGHEVVAFGEPPILASWQAAAFDHSTLVAWWLTWACYPGALIPLCIALLIVAWRLPTWRTRALVSIVVLLLSWRGADLFQHVFARPRPLLWAVKHETTFGYPSSHAAIVVGFYWLWAGMLYYSNPRSRLALGAHNVTDLLGGILLGGAFVAAAAAIVPGLFARDARSLSAAAE
jgi:membrane-associated phospholipid phosphatase